MKPLTREDILRNLPNSSEATIRLNLGQTGIPATMKQSSIYAHAFEQMQRMGGNRTGKTDLQDAIIAKHVASGGTVEKITSEIIEAAVSTVADMGPIWGSKEQAVKVAAKFVQYHEEKTAPKQARTGEWVEIGGKRFYLRSHWEKNFAHYLEFLKQRGYIRDWTYEPRTFWFEGIKRGVCSYKPDFMVTLNDGSIEYREVKGYFDRRSKTKLKRMKKYHPTIKVRVIDGTWFKAHGRNMAEIVPGWTRKRK